MRMRTIFFVAAVQALLAINRGGTMSVPGAETLVPGVINMSPTEEKLVGQYSPTKLKDYREQSQQAFKAVGQRYDYSRSIGAVVHIEDGEPDDHIHNGLAALDGVIPDLVIVRAGPWRVRKETTTRLWSAYKDLFFPEGKERPPVLAIHGDKEEDFSTWDKIDGEGVLTEGQLKDLRERSQLLEEDPEYVAEVNRASSALLDLMKERPYTTILLKTAPTGLTELIEQVPHYQDRIAIVWTAAVAWRARGGFTPRFNWSRDKEAGDKLLALGVPITMLSPALSDTDMIAIFDKHHLNSFNRYSLWPSRFPGFDQLRKFVTAQNVIAKSLDTAQRTFMEQKMEKHVTDMEILQNRVHTLLQELDAQRNNQADSDTLKGLERRLKTAETERDEHISRGGDWKKIKDEEVRDGSYRDYCAVDPFAHIPMNAQLRQQSLITVAQVILERQPQIDELSVEARPSSNGHVFICTKANSDPLSEKLQKFISSVVAAEPKEVKSIGNSEDNSKPRQKT